jgi:two-component system, OmpR family, sensor histidine kinase TctE
MPNLMHKIKNPLLTTSLSRQLFGWLMLYILPVIFISAVVAYFLSNQYANLAYDKALYRKALALSDQIEISNGELSINLPQIARDLIEFDEDDDIYYRIIGPSGDLINTFKSLPLPKKLPELDQHLYYTIKQDNVNIRIVAYRFSDGERNINASHNIYVLVGETLQKRHLMTNEIILGMVAPQLIIILLVSLLLFYGVKRGLKPLKKIQSELKSRDVDDLSLLNSELAPEEVKPLLDAFNDLLTKVKHNIAQQQRFISDASHQLKTPLAGLKTQAELAIREGDPVKVKHALSQINLASSNLSHLVNQLLSLSKAEPDGSVFLTLEPIDLKIIAQESTAESINLALKKEIDIEFSCNSKTATILGNAMLVKELILNLIDNAIRYTPNKGKVTVGVENNDHNICFYVQDNGIGIDPKYQTQIFERFYRVLGTKVEGCGLGLTIVKEIADRHHATVELLSEGENMGAKFTVYFPKNQA